MRVLSTLVACACIGLAWVSHAAATLEYAATPCPARLAAVEGLPLSWHQGSAADAEQLDRWCRAVGPPILVAQPALPPPEPPRLDEVIVVTWNAHMAEGRLPELVRALRAGTMTGGTPVNRFVLLIQEAYRRGAAVPDYPDDARSAFGIVPHDPHGTDTIATARSLGLAVWYAPSMRNGREMREDRGSAIVTTEALLEPRALELPLARQRRVAVGATIAVRTDRGIEKLLLLSAHLEPVSSPRSLWLFHNPRPGQVNAILSLVASPGVTPAAAHAGTVIGGDFNTIRGGAREDTYDLLRQWSTSLASEDGRRTHLMGRLDYLFFRLNDGWRAGSRRLDERFGSDHYPVIGQFVESP